MSALERLAPLVKLGMVLGLDAMRAALHAWGDPQERIPCVHVAGTNGKGSVSATLEAVLRESGVRTGLYTSPHLHRFVERVRVSGEPVSAEVADEVAAEILDAIGTGALPSLTFFEAVTLLAWRVFEREGVELAVMEVGLGGRLDATTVCAPRVTAITRIARDHTALLGDSLEAIAREKAGILKAGVPCVLGRGVTGDARRAIEEVAREVGAPLVDAPEVTWRHGEVRATWRGREVPLRPALVGPWQAENLAVALGVLEALGAQGVAVDEGALARGVASVRWPARMERIGDVLLDAAHNVDGAEALARALPEVLAGERVGAVVFGASRDKEWPAMLSALAPMAPVGRWFFAAAAMQRAAEPELLAGVRGGVACGSPEEALARARAAVATGEVVLVCGSIFLVAAVRAALLGIAQDPPIPM